MSHTICGKSRDQNIKKKTFFKTQTSCILTDNDKNIDFSKQAGHNVVLIRAYWPPGGFADFDLPWICNSM